MKIKVVTLKDICKYLAKISLVFGVITIFANFFYSKKNVNGCFSFNSSTYMSTIKNEILLLKDEEEIDSDVMDKNYIAQTLNNEFSMFKSVATGNLPNTVIANNNENNSTQKTDENETQATETNTNSADTIVEAQTGVNVEMIPSSIPDKYTYEIFGVKLRNESSYDLSAEITDLNVEVNKQDFLIFHTHTCESYTPTEQYSYNATGTFRTTDFNYSVVRVGDELEKYLKNYGYNVIHDKTYHDYPAYNGSYDRSIITVKNLLSTYQNTDIVIDLHRDAIGDNTYAPKVKIGDEYCARIMFVIGTDGGGLKHKNWRENLKFAIKVQQKAEELYPRIM